MHEALREPLDLIAWYVLEEPGQLQVLVPSCWQLAKELTAYVPAVLADLQDQEDVDIRVRCHLEGRSTVSGKQWLRTAFQLPPDSSLAVVDIFEALLMSCFSSGVVSDESKGVINQVAAKMSEHDQQRAAEKIIGVQQLMTMDRLDEMGEGEAEKRVQVILIFTGAIIRQLCSTEEFVEPVSTEQWAAQQLARVALMESNLQAAIALETCKMITSNLIQTDECVIQIAECLKSISKKGKINLHLCFKKSRNLTDKALEKLASSLPKELTSLHLDLHGKNFFTDKALEMLASSLPKELTSLHLDFYGYFTDKALEKLASSLPKELTSLHLNFYGYNKFTDKALEKMASSLPKELTSLHLDFYGNNNFTDKALEKLASSLPKELTSLHLNFCGYFTDKALEKLASSLPKELTSLHLDFYGNNNFTDKALEKLASSLPKELTSLHLDFYGNNNFTDKALEKMASSLPKELTSLHLNFCGYFTDKALEKLASSLPKELTSLHLNFYGYNKFTDKALEKLASSLPKELTRFYFRSSEHTFVDVATLAARSSSQFAK